jgi:iron complex transport system substrate-binding protein
MVFYASNAARAADAPPMRIVSINLCIDAILVELVPQERIAAITHYSRDPYRSIIATQAQYLPITYETAEEVVALNPDLVLASRHSAIVTRNALRRVGIRYELFDVPDTVAASLDQIRRIATLVGREPQGELLVARIQSALEAARRPFNQPILSAAIYQPGGLTAGLATVTGELMTIVGLRNVAERYDITSYQPLPLELLISAPPQVLLVGETSAGAPMGEERIVHHRALRALESQMQQEIFPARLLYCAGPTMIDALGALVAARDDAQRALASGKKR